MANDAEQFRKDILEGLTSEPIEKETTVVDEVGSETTAGEGAEKGDTTDVTAIDYKAELERKTRELEQAQFLLKKNNIDSKKKKENPFVEVEEDLDEPEGDKPDDEPSVDQKLENFKLEQLKDTISDELKALSSDANEQALIDFHFKNTIRRTGDSRDLIREDLKTAQLIANRKRFEKIDTELKARNQSKPEEGAGSGGHDISNDRPVNLEEYSAEDLKLLKRYGADPNDIKN